MGEVVHGECVTNALPVDDGWGTSWSLDIWRMWDMLREFLAGVAEGGVATAEPLLEEADEEEKEEKEEQGRGPSMVGGVAPLQVPEPKGRPLGPGFWLGGQSAPDEVQEVPVSKKARGKVHAVEPPPPEMDEKLVGHL